MSSIIRRPPNAQRIAEPATSVDLNQRFGQRRWSAGIDVQPKARCRLRRHGTRAHYLRNPCASSTRVGGGTLLCSCGEDHAYDGRRCRELLSTAPRARRARD